MPAIRTRIEERSGGSIAHVTVDHPAKLNTLNTALMGEMIAAADTLSAHEALRAVVLAGEGPRAFIGGANIAEMAGLDPLTGRAFITRLHECCESLRRIPVPVIARIEGYCFGGGLEIAAACDLRLAAETATFGMPEVRLGIPSVIEAALLPTLVGWSRAREILLLGETFSALDAARWGLVQKVVPATALDDAVEAWIIAILACGPRALRLQKQLIQTWEDLPLKAAIAAGIDAFAAAFESDEPRFAMERFLAAAAARKRGEAHETCNNDRDVP